MNWIELGRINDFRDFSYRHWSNGIILGYLIYFSVEDGITIKDAVSLKTIYNNRGYAGSIMNYYVFNNQLFFCADNRLFQFDFELNKLNPICETEESQIGMLSMNIAVGGTYSRRPRINKYEIIRINGCKPFYKWENKDAPIHESNDDIVIFENTFEGSLKGVLIEKSEKLWSLPLIGFSIPRFYKSLSENLFLFMQSFDTSHPVDKRYELWGINKQTGEILYKSSGDHFNTYIFVEKFKKLVGIRGQRYLSVDPMTGEILRNHKIDDLGEGLNSLWANIGRQSVSGDYINFTVSREPLIGRFNIKSEKLEEFIEIDIDKTKVDPRMPLETPIVHQGFLYVRDNSGVMHILKNTMPV